MLAVDLLAFGAFLALGFDAAGLAANHFVSTTLLLASGIAFLVGGAIAFGSGIFSTRAKEQIFHKEEQWSVQKLKKNEQRAHPYLLLAFVLFVESILFSLFAV